MKSRTSSLIRTFLFCRILLSHSAIAVACFLNFAVRSRSSLFQSLIIYSIQNYVSLSREWKIGSSFLIRKIRCSGSRDIALASNTLLTEKKESQWKSTNCSLNRITDKCSTSSTLLPTISDGSLGAWEAAGVIAVEVAGLQKTAERKWKCQSRIQN